MPSRLFAPFRAAGRWASGLFTKSAAPTWRAQALSLLRRVLDGSAQSNFLWFDHRRQTEHVVEGQGAPWTYIAAHTRAVKAAEATVTVYRDEDPRRQRGLMLKRAAYTPASRVEEMLTDAAERLDTDGIASGYGQLYWHPRRKAAWYVTADTTSGEDAAAAAQALEDAGAADVTVESEGHPPADKGWVQLYPQARRHLSKAGRKRFYQKSCRAWSRRAQARLTKAIDHPHDLDRPDRRPVSDRDPLARLLRRPNPGQTASQFIFAITFQRRICGGVYVWEVKDKQFGRVRELYVIPAALAEPRVPSAEFPYGSLYVRPAGTCQGAVGHGGFTAPGALGTLLTTGGEIDNRDVFKIGWPGPLFPGDFLSPLKAGSMTVDISAQVDRARLYGLQNEIDPSYVFEADSDVWKDMNPEEKEAWLETVQALNAGTLNRKKAMMPPPGITAKDSRRTAVEMDFVKAYEQLRDAELALHQTPPPAAGIQSAGAYAAYFAALKQFLDVIQPEFDDTADTLAMHLGPLFAGYQNGRGEGDEAPDYLDHGYEIEIKAKAIDDPDLKDRVARNILTARCMTKDKFLKFLGLPESGESWGKEIVCTEPQPGTDPLEALQGLVPGAGGAPAASAAGVPKGLGVTPDGAGGSEQSQGSAPADNTPQKASATQTGVQNPSARSPVGRPNAGPAGLRTTKAWHEQPRNWHGKWFERKHEYGCVYAPAPDLLADLVRAFAAGIPAADLAEEGRESQPHLTALFGTEDVTPADVAAALADVRPFGVRLRKTEVFQNEDADVLVVGIDPVESPAIVGLHEQLRETLGAPGETHPDYRPHLCIAYLKPGAGAKYAGKDFVEGVPVTFDRLVYSDPSGGKTELPLGVTSTRAILNEEALDIAEGEGRAPKNRVAALLARNGEANGHKNGKVTA